MGEHGKQLGGGTMLTIKAISLGSNAKGRDFGILAGSRSVRLTGEATTILSDFSLALLHWGQTHHHGFDAFFPVHADGSLHCLVRVAHLGPGQLGPMILANALLLSREECDALKGCVHQLIDQIQPPRDAPWKQTEMETDASEFTLLGESKSDLSKLGSVLHLCERGIVVHSPDPGRVVRQLLDNAIYLPGLLHSWITTTTLGSNGRFDAQTFHLLVTDLGASPANVFVYDGKSLSGPDLPNAPAWEVWEALVRKPLADRAGARWVKGLESLIWNRDILESSPSELALAIMREFMAAPSVGGDEFWEAMLHWTDASAALETEMRAIVQRSLAFVFGEVIQQQADLAAQTSLCEDYWSRLAPKLPDAPRALIPRLALEAGLLPKMSRSTLKAMVQAALIPVLFKEFAGSIRPASFSNDQLAMIATQVCPIPGEETSRRKAVVVGSAVALAALEPTASAKTAPDELVELSRQVLDLEPDQALRRRLSNVLINVRRTRPCTAITDEIMADVKSALRLLTRPC